MEYGEPVAALDCGVPCRLLLDLGPCVWFRCLLGACLCDVFSCIAAADDGFGKKRPSEESYGGERNKRAHVDSSEKPFAIKVAFTIYFYYVLVSTDHKILSDSGIQ
jgi:hypothetical protein